MSVGDEFARRVSDDELCAEVRQAVEGDDEDALRRLGFGGFGGYAQRLSELMSDSVREGHDPKAEDFAAIMEEVARPAHYAHHLVNEAGTAVQRAKDEPLGIHIKPQEADFDDDALKSTVGNAASMDTPEKTVEALAEGLAYAVKKVGNDFIKANAEAHSRAGFEVKVKRSGSTKCCPWCAARIGSWAIANAPDGVFGCHANCSCTVEYTSSTGAKTSARGANLHRYGAGAFVEVEYQPPHVGAVQGAEKAPHRLTGGGNGGIIEDRNRLGYPIKPIEKTYDMMLDKTTYAYAVAEKYHINLRGSGQKITILVDPSITSLGKTKKCDPKTIIIGLSAFSDEINLANTIAHELNHCRSWLKGGDAPEVTAYAAGDALEEYIRGER